MDVQLLPIQYKLLTSDSKVAAMVCGIGNGKTFTCAHFVLQMITEYPESNGLIVANTYSQLISATLPAIKNLFDDLDIEYSLVLGGAKKHLTVGKTTVFIYSLEVPDNIRGIECGWLCADEAAYSSKKAIDVIFGRLRDRRGPLKARFFTSPNGFNFFYDFVTKNNVEVLQGRTKDNIFLPEGYYEQLLELYGGENSPLARQELFGEFCAQNSNAVYYAFNRANHVRQVTDNKNQPVYIGVDFNVGMMTASVVQYDKTGFSVIDTIILKDHNANTFSMGQEILQRYGARAVLIPDSTANARKTSADAGITDIRILKNMGLKVESTLNPRIKDRHNTVNILLYKNRLRVAPHCVELIKELETLSNEDDEGSVSHVAVNLGYVAHKLEPLTLPKRESTTNPFLKRGNK